MSASTAVGATNVSKASRYRELIVERRGRVLLVQFNRPAFKNALNRLAFFELIRVLGEATRDEEVALVVFTGVGDVFTAGVDLTQMQHFADPSEYLRTANYVLSALVRAFLRCPKVLVAVVNGLCIGAGFTLSALCDVVYCTATACFEAPFTRLGICPELCSSYVFPRIFGQTKASELLLFGTKLTAHTALACGFVAAVYEPAEIADVLLPQLVSYAALPMQSLLVTKKLLRRNPSREVLLQTLDAECAELAKLRRGETYLRTINQFTAHSHSNKSKL